MTKSPAMPQARHMRVVAALAIVFGVLGMHGLSVHGSNHAGAAEIGSIAHMSLPDLASAHEEHLPGNTATSAASKPSSAETSPASTVVEPDSGGTGHTLRDMAMLCLATLAVAAALLAIALCLRRVPRMWAVLSVAVDHLPYRCLTPRGTGPPYAWRFSVIRC